MEPAKADNDSYSMVGESSKTKNTVLEYSEPYEGYRLIEARQERNKDILKQLNKSSLLDLCDEYSIGTFHLNEECEEEHCSIGKQVFCLISDLVRKCSEIDPKFESKLLWVGSSAEGTKMWLPDEFDFLMELVGLRGKCECNNVSLSLTTVRVKDESQELWSDICFDKDPSFLSPTKLKNCFTSVVKRAATLLDKNKYKSLRFDDMSPYLENGITDTKVGINILTRWYGYEYKNMKINIDLTPGIPLLLPETELSNLKKHSIGTLTTVDNYIHVVPHRRFGGMWRPSFSITELHIMKKLTREQTALYRCLKLCRDIHTKSLMHPSIFLIPSYYLKTLLFNYLFQNTDSGSNRSQGSYAETIEQESFTASFLDILRCLIQASSYRTVSVGGTIPHFFVKFNFLIRRYDLQWCEAIVSRLEKTPADA